MCNSIIVNDGTIHDYMIRLKLQFYKNCGFYVYTIIVASSPQTKVLFGFL